MSEQDNNTPAPNGNTPTEPASNPVEREIYTLDIHHADMREASDPDEDFDPGPIW